MPYSRTFKSGAPVWYASFMHSGKLVQERVGTDKRQAEIRERQRKREVAAGTYVLGSSGSRAITFGAYASRWFESRKTRSKSDDEARIKNHVVPVLGDRPIDEIAVQDLLSLVEGLRDGGKLAPKTIRHIYGLLVTIFRRAVRDRLIASSPCLLEKHELPSPHELSPRSREPGAYTLPEAEALMSDERVRLDRRVLYALAILTGMRHGEVAGLRWRDVDKSAAPLGRINLKTQKDGAPLKTNKAREIPVHPALQAVLAEWHLSGWGSFILRAPKPDDLIVPTTRNTIRHEHTSLDLLTRDAKRIGVPARRFHDLRHTCISLYQDVGAPRDVVEMWTHASKMRVIDRYTHLHWQTKCEAASRLKVDLRRGVVIALKAREGTTWNSGAHDVSHDVPPNIIASAGIDNEMGRPQRDSNPIRGGHSENFEGFPGSAPDRDAPEKPAGDYPGTHAMTHVMKRAGDGLVVALARVAEAAVRLPTEATGRLVPR